jgi:hypothetical protein
VPEKLSTVCGRDIAPQGFSVYPKGPEKVKKKPSLAIIKKIVESEKWRKWILAYSRILSKLGKKAW